jgi:MtrB/PioB family decaheme-associated outer membrane protein
MATLRAMSVAALACGITVSAMAMDARADGNQFTIGGQWWDQTAPEAKYDEFREVPMGGFVESFMVREMIGRQSVALWGVNAIRSDQSTQLTWADGARWRVDLGYAEIPHTFSHIARWGWNQPGAGVFVLPDSLQSANQRTPANYTKNMTDFLNTSAPVIPLGLTTKVSSARLRARPARGWQFEIRANDRVRSGNKAYAMSFGFNTALENPEPIDQRTVNADAIADYHRDRLTVQADAGLSTFDNHVDVLRVDNPKRFTDVVGGDGAATGVTDLYPNNTVVRGSVALGYTLPRYTAVNATVAIAQTTQDDRFLDFTNNKALNAAQGLTRDSLAAQSLDGKARQLNGNLSISTRPINHLDGTATFRYTDYDNQTAERDWIGQSPYEASWQRYIELTSPARDNKQWVTGLDVNYAFTPRIRAGGIAEYRVRERNDREVEKDTETLLGGRVRTQLTDQLSINGKYTHGDRQADTFNQQDYLGFKSRTAIGSTPGLFDSLAYLEQPGLRRFDVADRIQDNVNADAWYAFGERVDLSGSYVFLRNDFARDTTLGLQEEQVNQIAVTGIIHVSDKLDLNGSYGYSKAKTFQRSRQSGSALSFNPVDNWTARIDEHETFGVAGVDWMPGKRISVSADYEFSRNETDYDLDNGAHTAVDLPSTLYRRHESVLDVIWHWQARTSIIGRWGWEQYTVDDFATESVPLIFPTTGNASAIYLGDSSQDFTANRLALLVRHTF